MNQTKSELDVTRERENASSRERAELATQLAEAQKARANLECELENHHRYVYRKMRERKKFDTCK